METDARSRAGSAPEGRHYCEPGPSPEKSSITLELIYNKLSTFDERLSVIEQKFEDSEKKLHERMDKLEKIFIDQESVTSKDHPAGHIKNEKKTVEDEEHTDRPTSLDVHKNWDIKLIRRDIKLPVGGEGKLAFVLFHVMTKQECDEYIKVTEEMGYEKALVNMGGDKQKLLPKVRNSYRCIWDSEEEARKIWDRIRSYVPEIWNNRKVKGLNERLRFLRYDPGEYFAPHYDGIYQRKNGERSYITVQLYLNEGYEGGSTTFLCRNEKDRKEVIPRTGTVLVFQHDILHEGSILIKGRKYCMRTDVMYSAEEVKTGSVVASKVAH